MKDYSLKWAVDYLEEHLDEPVDLEELAKTGYISLMQLYREFYRVTGHSIKDYIRKRRVSNACAEIKHSDISITDIACRNGFESLSSFTRIFKKIVGFTPLEYRKSPVIYTFLPDQFPFYRDHPAVKVHAEGEWQGVSGIFVSPEETDIERQAVSALYGSIRSTRKNGMDFRIFGVTNVEIKPPKSCYKVFIHTGDGAFWTSALREAGFRSIVYETVTRGEYAELTVPFCSTAGRAWDYLYSTWLAKSAFDLAGEHCFEEYIFQKTGGGVKGLKLLIPVCKRQNSHKIKVTRLPERTLIMSRAEGEDAEETASHRLASWIHRLGLWPKTYLVEAGDNRYSCGAEVQEEMPDLLCVNGLSMQTMPAGWYATLSAPSLADYAGLADILNRWLDNDGQYVRSGELFALYSLDDTYKEITMTVCLPVAVNSVKNGQTKCFHKKYNPV